MKHDDKTLQAAIDAAMLEIGKQVSGKNFAACPKYYRSAWPEEADDRLALAKSFLAKLPEAQPILADDGRSLTDLRAENRRLEKELAHQLDMGCQAAVCGPKVALDEAIRRMEAVPVEEVAEIIRRQWLDRGGWIEPAADALRARLIQAAKGQGEQPDTTDWKARAEKAEAELAALKSSQIGILRPLAEAGTVPDGCARVTGLFFHPERKWLLTARENPIDTHFADIRLPGTETPAPVNKQPKQQVPLGPEDVMPCSLLRNKEGVQYLVQFSDPAQMRFSARTTVGLDVLGFRAAMDDSWQINRSIPLTGKWDANAWEPCYKLI